MASETLVPTGQVTWTNLDGSYADIDDDPDSPDGNWGDNITEDSDTVAHVSFDSPSGNLTIGADLQEFKAWVRKTQAGGTNPTCAVMLYESGNGGNPLATSGEIEVTSESGQMITLTWNANLLTAVSGADVECYVYGNASGGKPSNRRGVDVGAVEWNVDYSTVSYVAILKRYDGASWVKAPLKVYTGGSWQEKPLKVYKDSAWGQVDTTGA